MHVISQEIGQAPEYAQVRSAPTTSQLGGERVGPKPKNYVPQGGQQPF